jgi:hypothetical protein
MNTHESEQNGNYTEEPTLNPEEEEKQSLEASSDENNEINKQEEDKKWRAKLYQLNAEGGWDDLGTGYSHVDTKK